MRLLCCWTGENPLFNVGASLERFLERRETEFAARNIRSRLGWTTLTTWLGVTHWENRRHPVVNAGISTKTSREASTRRSQATGAHLVAVLRTNALLDRKCVSATSIANLQNCGEKRRRGSVRAVGLRTRVVSPPGRPTVRVNVGLRENCLQRTCSCFLSCRSCQPAESRWNRQTRSDLHFLTWF